MYFGLKFIRLYRTIADTPLSKIASAAMGENVEIIGQVVDLGDECIEAPLSKITCVAYYWVVRFDSAGLDRFKTPLSAIFYYSSPYIYLHDGDKDVLAAVDLSSCYFSGGIFDRIIAFSNETKDVPDEVKNILSSHGLYDVSLKKTQYTVMEKVFQPDDVLYALGTAQKKLKGEFPKYTKYSPRFGTRFTTARRQELLKKSKFLLSIGENNHFLFGRNKVYLSSNSEKHNMKYMRWAILSFLLGLFLVCYAFASYFSHSVVMLNAIDLLINLPGEALEATYRFIEMFFDLEQ
jgi:hypothetical protein